jgi:hypothetical protein
MPLTTGSGIHAVVADKYIEWISAHVTMLDSFC